LTAPMRLRAADALTVVEIDGESVVYDDATGNLHHLNPTATVVFSLCDGTATARELATEIAEAFEQPADEVERQIRRLLRELRSQGLLVPATRERVGATGGADG
jgi:PqqD family protein of HPr-rel-A system